MGHGRSERPCHVQVSTTGCFQTWATDLHGKLVRPAGQTWRNKQVKKPNQKENLRESPWSSTVIWAPGLPRSLRVCPLQETPLLWQEVCFWPEVSCFPGISESCACQHVYVRMVYQCPLARVFTSAGKTGQRRDLQIAQLCILILMLWFFKCLSSALLSCWGSRGDLQKPKQAIALSLGCPGVLVSWCTSGVSSSGGFGSSSYIYPAQPVGSALLLR